MARYLFIDANYLCHRAFHTTGALTYHSVATGVAFGVIREAANLLEWYRPAAVAWCFDSVVSKRAKRYPAYKANRRPVKGKERRLREALADQLKALRKEYLPAMGFRNVFQRKGFEADDLIAHLARGMHFADEAVIVAADHDLYQCLTPQVKMYNPATKKEYTCDDFRKEWNHHPTVWARCKAIAGCSSDNVKGVDGVGEKTAMKWLRNELPDDHRLAKLILKNMDVVNRNIELVTLPLPGIPCDGESYVVRPDKLTRKRWRRVCKNLGIKSVPYPEMATDV